MEFYDPRDAIIKERFRNIKYTVLIGSGKGGVGKSTISAILALKLSREGFNVGLLDLDLHGPVIPEILGLENTEPEESKKGLVPPETLGVKVMSIGFFAKNEAIPLRGKAKTNAIKELLAITNWGSLDFLVVDLPPGTGDETLTSVESINGSRGALIVTIPSRISLSVVERAIRLFSDLKVPVLALINNMAYYVIAGERAFIMGEGNVFSLANKYNIEYVIEIPFDFKIAKALDENAPEKLLETEVAERIGKIVEILKNKVERRS